MVVMSLITHILAFVNIPHFFEKNVLPAILRLAGALVTLVAACLLFQARWSAGFPADAGSLAILPATCFVDISDMISSNGSLSNSISALLNDTGSRGKSTELGLIIMLCILMIIAVIFLLVDSYSDWLHNRFVFIIRAAVTIASTAIATYATVKHTTLQSSMEIPEWYSDSGSKPYTYAQIVSLTLLASAAIPVFKSIQGRHRPLVLE